MTTNELAIKEIGLAQEQADFFANDPMAKKVWSDDERADIIAFWNRQIELWKERQGTCDHDCNGCDRRVVTGDEEHCLNGEDMR